MPLYEYRCTSCEHRFETLQRMGEGAESLRCPECGTPEPSRLFSTFAAGSGGGSGKAVSAGAGCGGGSGFT